MPAARLRLLPRRGIRGSAGGGGGFSAAWLRLVEWFAKVPFSLNSDI